MAIQYPSLLVKVAFWRYTVVSKDSTKYGDEQLQVWVRIAESIPAFYFEKNERFYQSTVGIINQRKRYILCPDDLGLVAGDHVVVNGNSMLITEHGESVGVCKLTVEQEKSNFIHPGRGVPTYRQCSIKARLL